MKILIAEDDRNARGLLCDILASAGAGYDVIACENGKLAWEALQAHPDVRVCILDVMMPEVDGIELLKRVRADERLKPLPVILCTALNDRTTVAQAMALRIDGYLVKPFNRSGVLERVKKAVESADMRRRTQGILENEAEVCARLGTTVPAYRGMVKDLAHGALQWADDFQKSVSPDRNRLLLPRASAFRRASANLGARPLSAAFTEMERVMQQPATAPAEQAALAELATAAARAVQEHAEKVRGVLS
jgi:two-component system chemotaxis response regulator CheY